MSGVLLDPGQKKMGNFGQINTLLKGRNSGDAGRTIYEKKFGPKDTSYYESVDSLIYAKNNRKLTSLEKNRMALKILSRCQKKTGTKPNKEQPKDSQK